MKFPDSTYFNRKLPKQRFYENLTISAATKKSFVDQIKSIYWENKISADTINIAAENKVTEIEIFRIFSLWLKQKVLWKVLNSDRLNRQKFLVQRSYLMKCRQVK